MINLNSTWIIDSLRIVIFGDDLIPFKETETSSFLTENHISASIKHDENGEDVIKEVTSLEDGTVFILSYFEKQNIIEFSLNIDKETKKDLLNTFFNKIKSLAKKFYDNDPLKVKRVGVISSFHKDDFDGVKDSISTMSFLKSYDDFDIRLNKSLSFDEVKINQAININSSERLFVKIEERLNIPITDMKKVAGLVIDVNTDIENVSIRDYSKTLIRLVELSENLIANGGSL